MHISWLFINTFLLKACYFILKTTKCLLNMMYNILLLFNCCSASCWAEGEGGWYGGFGHHLSPWAVVAFDWGIVIINSLQYLPLLYCQRVVQDCRVCSHAIQLYIESQGLWLYIVCVRVCVSVPVSSLSVSLCLSVRVTVHVCVCVYICVYVCVHVM